MAETRRKFDADFREGAVRLVRETGKQPLEAYDGLNQPWRCCCTKCGIEVRPRLAHVRSRGRGCRYCGHEAIAAARRHDPEDAARQMRNAGYLPLEPYPGSDQAWRCQHLTCGREMTAKLCKIRSGEGCCRYCAAHGFNLANPAVVYVLHNPVLGAVKVGITGGDERIGRYIRNGWASSTPQASPQGQARGPSSKRCYSGYAKR